MYVSGAATEFQNNIVANNTGSGGGVAIYSGATVEYNDSYGHSTNFSCSGCTTSSTNIQQNPRFTDAASGAYGGPGGGAW